MLFKVFLQFSGGKMNQKVINVHSHFAVYQMKKHQSEGSLFGPGCDGFAGALGQDSLWQICG